MFLFSLYTGFVASITIIKNIKRTHIFATYLIRCFFLIERYFFRCRIHHTSVQHVAEPLTSVVTSRPTFWLIRTLNPTTAKAAAKSSGGTAISDVTVSPILSAPRDLRLQHLPSARARLLRHRWRHRERLRSKWRKKRRSLSVRWWWRHHHHPHHHCILIVLQPRAL